MTAKQPRVAIATTTFSPNTNDLRLALARKTLSALADLPYDVFVVDGSKDEGVIEALTSMPCTYIREAEGVGMGGSRRQAIKAALDSGADIIVWMEPEKYPLVQHLQTLLNYMGDGSGADLILPRRRSLRSYPPYQMAKELEGNHEMGSLTGRPDLDAWFGPRVMNRKAAELFVSYTGEFGDRWESIFIPVLIAIQQGMAVDVVTVDYIHPAEQTAAESDPSFDKKRDTQLNDLLASMAKFYASSGVGSAA